MHITRTSKQAADQQRARDERVRTYEMERKDFRQCPECHSRISLWFDVEIVAWDYGRLHPIYIKDWLRANDEPVRMYATCPKCGCEWESNEF